MFKKTFLIIATLGTSIFGAPLLADNPPKPEEAPIGKYQMTVVNTGVGIRLYLLDTTTGQVWKSTNQKNWVDHDVWELQIAESPEPQ